MPASGLLFGAIVFVPSALFYLIALRPKDTMTAPTLPTIQDLIDAVRARAEARPDFVYKPEGVRVDEHGARHRISDGEGELSCVYVEDGETSCIVGCGAADIGVPLSTMEHSTTAVGPLIGRLARDLVIAMSMSQEQRSWLDRVQAAQDHGYSWGDSVAYADNRHKSPVVVDENGEMPWRGAGEIETMKPLLDMIAVPV